MNTGVPSGVRWNRLIIRTFGSRTQPCETGLPIEKRSFVPWMPIGPPSVHVRSTSENAEIPSARGPYGPVVGETTNRCVTKKDPSGVGVDGLPIAAGERSTIRPAL